MRKQPSHEYTYPHVTEAASSQYPRPYGTFDPDNFLDGLELNYQDLEEMDTCVADYAKRLSKAGRAAAQLATPVDTNVYYLDDYRHGTTPEAA